MTVVSRKCLPVFILLVSCFALGGLLNNMTKLDFRNVKAAEHQMNV